jgi:hypothetical protein
MMEKLVEWTVLAGETEVLGENPSRRHFVHHKSHLPDPGANSGHRGGKPATNRFSYGAVSCIHRSINNQRMIMQEIVNVIIIFFLILIVGGWSPKWVHWARRPLLAYCIWLWGWRIWWNEDWQGKPQCSEKTCPSATFSATIPAWQDPGANPDSHCGKPAPNRLRYGAALFYNYSLMYVLTNLAVLHTHCMWVWHFD